jgi:RNA polymerase sigma-54 factor
MSLQMDHFALPSQEQQPTQWLVLTTQLLAASSADLMSMIQQEAIENPALEVEEHPHCTTCGQALKGVSCQECSARGLASVPPTEHSLLRDELPSWSEPHTLLGESDHAVDPSLYVPSPVSLADTLTSALQAELPAEDAPIIEYLVGCLDEHGYLRASLDEAAHVLKVSSEQIERVLARLQSLDPPGIGARNVRECLLLQLRALEARGQPEPTAYAVVEGFLSELSQGRYMQIARQLNLTRKEVEQAHAFIQRHLTPFPALAYVEDQPGHGQHSSRPAVPDVVIRRLDGEQPRYEVEIVEAQRFSVRVDPAYIEAYQHLRQQTGGSAEDHQHIYQAMTRARFFLSGLRQRWQTLAKITWELIEQQEAFLEQGAGALLPLTRAELAASLGVHPSTVSRATNEKYVLLPNAQIVPFSTFFTASLPIKVALQEILEQAAHPLSDQRLSELLAAQGIQVARRTVTKYRAELRQPAAFRRTTQRLACGLGHR